MVTRRRSTRWMIFLCSAGVNWAIRASFDSCETERSTCSRLTFSRSEAMIAMRDQKLCGERMGLMKRKIETLERRIRPGKGRTEIYVGPDAGTRGRRGEEITPVFVPTRFSCSTMHAKQSGYQTFGISRSLDPAITSRFHR